MGTNPEKVPSGVIKFFLWLLTTLDVKEVVRGSFQWREARTRIRGKEKGTAPKKEC